MHIQPYPILFSHRNRLFEFHSLGPKGLIRKIVLFQCLEGNVYNLAFGDAADEESFELHDDVVSDNEDMERVVRTVADCVHQFLGYDFEKIVLFKGFDERRNRLYRKMITLNQSAIEEEFVVLQGESLKTLGDQFPVVRTYKFAVMKKNLTTQLLQEKGQAYGNILDHPRYHMPIDLDNIGVHIRDRVMKEITEDGTLEWLREISRLREQGKI